MRQRQSPDGAMVSAYSTVLYQVLNKQVPVQVPVLS